MRSPNKGSRRTLLNLTSGQWNQNSDGPYTPGFVQPAAGNYDNYTQWVYHNNDTLTLVRDRGPVVPGIVSYALSPDGHELEMRAPFKGFLKDAANNANIALGKTLDISFSLEASGELFAPPGSNGTWASDTAAPIASYFLGFPGDYNDDGRVDAADYVVWRKTDGTQSGLHTLASQFRRTGRQRLGCQCECHRPRTGDAGAADVCGGWLVSPARPGRIESSRNSLTHDTGQQPTDFDTRFSVHGIGAGKRLRRAFETGPGEPCRDLPQQWND